MIANKKKIWIDFDNSPHVVFFRPIIRELERYGCRVILTARDCFQVCGLADYFGMKYKRIGRHYGKNVALKIMGTVARALQLVPVGFREKPDIAVSHGSRSQLVACSLLRIPVVILGDYEHAKGLSFIKPDWVMTPDLIPKDAHMFNNDRVLQYPGIKEDVYVPDFKPDKGILKDLGLDEDNIIVTIRPPATEAHYHNPESEILFAEVLETLGKNPKTRMVILPRNEIKQTKWIKDKWKEWYQDGKIMIPDHVVDGLNMIWHSDFVISGGGTMNREAAALGVPVYTIFRGKIGAIDRYLSDNGRLVILETVDDVREKIKVEARKKTEGLINRDRPALGTIVKHILDILEKQ